MSYSQKIYIKFGTTRLVILVGKYAIKVPRPKWWKSFLKGIIANLDESLWYKNSPLDWKLKMAPVIGCYLKGFILIMRRAEPLTLEQYGSISIKDYYLIPMDNKIQNFGIYKGNIVLVDYADSRYFCSDCENIIKGMKQ